VKRADAAASTLTPMLLLGIDLGTSGTKAVLVNTEGRVVVTATHEHPLYAPSPGFSEQDPEDWWQSTVAAVREVLASSLALGKRVGAIGLSGQMHGLVTVDRRGATLGRCILWNDQRSVPQCAAVEASLGIEHLVALTGNRLLPGFTAPKMLWLREHDPARFAATAMNLLPKDWLRYRLSGAFATEVSDASGTLLFDCRNRRWSEAMCAALGIDRRTLPDCAESFEPTTRLSTAAAAALGLPADIPIVGGAGDQAASAIGAGIVRPGRVAVTIGTSGVVFAATEKLRPSPRGELHAFCHAIPNTWHVMGVMLSAGGSLRWFRDVMCGDAIRRAEETGLDAYELIAAEAEAIAPGADGLTFLPYLNGERCPHPDPRARGAFLGLSATHGRAHLARAVFEGITFGLRDNLDLLRASGVETREALLAGGGARSPWWRQLCADVLGVPVHAARGAEGGALGAALLAGVGAGVWSDVASACAAAGAGATSASLLPGPDASRYEQPLHTFRAGFRAAAASALH